MLRIFIYIVCAFFLVCNVYNRDISAQDDQEEIRVGWQTSWATQGQIAVLLQETNILELCNLSAEFKGFSYGGPLNEGALAGEVDVIFTADQPACMLIARGARWKIVARLIYNRVATIVPYSSSFQSLSDLTGKTIGIPFGAAAHRETLQALTEAGLNPMTDVMISNIGIYEQMNVIQKGTDSSWGEFAAFSTWDPALAELEYAKKARALDYGTVTSVIVVSEDFIENNPEQVISFLKTYIMAFYVYAQNQEYANRLFKEKSKLNFALEVLDLAASVEPNLKARELSDISIRLSEQDITVIQSGADFIYRQNLTDKKIDNINQYIDQQYLKKAEEELAFIKDIPLEYRSENNKT